MLIPAYMYGYEPLLYKSHRNLAIKQDSINVIGWLQINFSKSPIWLKGWYPYVSAKQNLENKLKKDTIVN